MKIIQEVCLDHSSAQTMARLHTLLAALGNGPSLRLAAVNPDDVVHGRLIAVCWCNTIELGGDYRWPDGQVRQVTAENVAQFLAEQPVPEPLPAHRLVKVSGAKAYGTTIIHLQITEEAEAPNEGRATTLARPDPFPSEASIRAAIDAWAAQYAPA